MKSRTQETRVAALTSLLMLPLPGLCLDLDKEVAFHIPAQDLSSALIVFSRQTRLQVIVSDDLTGQTAQSVDGRITIKRALNQLLRPTGLRYRVTGETSIAVGKALKTNDAQSGATRAGYQGSFIRLAQVTETDASSRVRSSDPASPDENARASDVEEVMVTGSRIRGHENPASQVYVVTSKDIEQRGLSNTDDIFRSLPQVSGRGSMQAMEINDQAPSGSIGHSTINLGGYGAKSTLVLINGRRTANSSLLFGDSVNVSTIPITAIERVEVLPTAAAAIYGADAVGGVVNIILKQRSQFETNTRVDYEDGSNGGDASQISQDLSFGWGSGRFTGVASYRETDPVTAHGTGLATQDFRSRGGYDMRSRSFGQTGLIADFGSLPPRSDGRAFTPGDVSAANFVPASSIAEYVVPDLRTKSVYINVEQELTSSFRLCVDALYSKNDADNYEMPHSMFVTVPATNAFNAFDAPVFVNYQFDTERDAGLMPSLFREADEELLQGTFGATISLPRDWQLQVYGTRAEEESLHTYAYVAYLEDPVVFTALADDDPQTALNVFGNGTAQNPQTLRSIISLWQGKRHTKIGSDMTLFSAQADGVLFDLPTSAVKGSFVAERRKDDLEWAGFGTNQPRGERTTDSIGAEFAVPLLTPSSGQLLDLTLAARWDRYNADGDFDYDGVQDHMNEFSATSPMIGLAWKPFRDLRLRASWIKAFRAPVVHDIAGANYTNQMEITDPLASGGPAQALVTLSYPASLNIGPEKAKIWTAGIDWQHIDASGAGLTTSLTYSDTDFSDRISGSYAYFILDPGYFVSHPEIFPDATGRDADGNLTNVYLRNINIAGQKSQVWSLDAAYSWATAGGLDFSVGTSMAYTDSFLEQIDEASAPTELAGTFRGPDHLRTTFRASINDGAGAWAANLFVNTSSSYDHVIPTSTILDPPAGAGPEITEKVSGYTTVDLTGSYQYRADSVWFDGITVTGGVRNLLDEDFPLINLSQGGRVLPFDPSRVDVRGRIMFLQVGKKFR